MKTRILYRFVPIIALAVIIHSCKKDNNNNSNAGTSDADLQTQSDDQTRVSNETDAVADDVTTMFTSQALVTGSSVKPSPGYASGIATMGPHQPDTLHSYICDAVVTMDTTAASNKITITYNGSNCWGTRSRT